jgi:flagellar assembly protein FliH
MSEPAAAGAGNPAARKSKVIRSEAQTAFQRWELPHLLTADQVERVQRQAHEEGYRQGYEQGLAAAQAETQARLAHLQQILQALSEPLAQLDETVEQELVAVVMAAVRLLVRREIKLDPAQVIAAVREAVGVLPLASRQIRVYLHPQDAAIVRQHLGEAGGEESWRIVEDPILTRGGCRVVTETSQVDATVESRLQAVMAALLGGERSHDP